MKQSGNCGRYDLAAATEERGTKRLGNGSDLSDYSYTNKINVGHEILRHTIHEKEIEGRSRRKKK